MGHVPHAESLPLREGGFIPLSDWISVINIGQRLLFGPSETPYERTIRGRKRELADRS
jgi:hypothetical protein